jgi:hypothetical protein
MCVHVIKEAHVRPVALIFCTNLLKNYIDIALPLAPSLLGEAVKRGNNHATEAIAPTNDRVNPNGLLALQHSKKEPPTNSHKNNLRGKDADFIEKFISRCNF